MVRTVSMLPAATEIVGALGLMDQLVAVSHECDYPEEANQRPRITHCEIYGRGLSSSAIDRWVSERLQSHSSLYTLDEKTLRELAPDLILTQRLCDVCAPAYGSVEAMAKTLPSKPRVLSLEPRRLEDILKNVVSVAQAMEHPDRGTALAASSKAESPTSKSASPVYDREPRSSWNGRSLSSIPGTGTRS
jgi:iron complex transport system substrate-binding protein